jgi:hypothetical protein
LPGLDQDPRAYQAFDDAGGGFRGNLQGVTKSVDRDKWRASVDDLLENGPHNFGTTGSVASVQLHNAALRSGVCCCWLGGRNPNLVAIRDEAIQQVGQAQCEQIDCLVHRGRAP